MRNTVVKIIKGDLHALLSVCTKEDLDPLVNIIKTKITSFLEIDENYKRYNPDHTKYHCAIADEILLFGGNTFANLIRGGKGPSYEEIVFDTCKRLNVPCKEKETLNNEKNLLDLYLDRSWQAIGESDRQKLVAEAAKETGINHKNVLASGALLLARGPAGISATIFSISDPAFSVTIPCVLNIAYLRRKYLEKPNSAMMAEHIANTSPLPRLTNKSMAMILENAAQLPVLSFSHVPKPINVKWNSVDSSNDVSKLNPLLQAIPSILTSAEVEGKRYMEVVINGPLLKAKGKDGFRLITMIDGKPSHGTLLEPDKLTNIVNASALFQVASVLVAQKHLADISRKLSEIKIITNRILSFQKNERCASIMGATHYFEQVAQPIFFNERSQSVRQQIEQHEANLLQIQQHLLDDICNENKAVLSIKDDTMFGSKGMEDAIRGQQLLIADLYKQLLICIRARACGWQLVAAYPGEEHLKESRRRSIDAAVGLLMGDGDLLVTTGRNMQLKIKSMTALWNSNLTINERKLPLLEWHDKLLNDISHAKQQIIDDLHTAVSVISEDKNSATILIEIENQNIVGFCPAPFIVAEKIQVPTQVC